MSVWDQIQTTLAPHASRLNQTIAASAVLIHKKLDDIHKAISDLGRPDIGDKWIRISVNRKFAAEEEFEPRHIPPNEIWLLQSIVVDGIFNKSPAFVIEVNNYLFASVIKEGVGIETVGGDMAMLKGDKLVFKARTEGTINCTLHFIRRQQPATPQVRLAAEGDPLYQGSNTHEIQRDLIASANGQWQESPREVRDVELQHGTQLPDYFKR